MENLAENIASAGELANCSSDMRIILYMFLFTFVITVTATIVGYLKGIGK